MTTWRKTLEPYKQPMAPPDNPVVGRRSPKTIKRFANRLRNLWREHPGLSLGELISRAFKLDELAQGDLAVTRDEDLINRLERHFRGV